MAMRCRVTLLIVVVGAVFAVVDGLREGTIDKAGTVSAGELRDVSGDAEFVRGVNHAHIHRRGRGYGSDTSRAELTELRAIGVN